VRTVRLDAEILGQIERHGRATYPDECCGFLLALVPEPDGPARDVVGVERALNRAAGEPRGRFAIPADQLRALERRLDGSGRGIVGVYHSHPDHPARPSEMDRELAWPWYSYLVTRVTAGAEGPSAAFELDSERREFVRMDLQVRSSGSGPRETQTLSADPPQ